MSTCRYPPTPYCLSYCWPFRWHWIRLANNDVNAFLKGPDPYRAHRHDQRPPALVPIWRAHRYVRFLTAFTCHTNLPILTLRNRLKEVPMRFGLFGINTGPCGDPDVMRNVSKRLALNRFGQPNTLYCQTHRHPLHPPRPLNLSSILLLHCHLSLQQPTKSSWVQALRLLPKEMR